MLESEPRDPGSWPACGLAEQSSLALSYSAGSSASSPHWQPWISQQTAPEHRKFKKHASFTARHEREQVLPFSQRAAPLPVHLQPLSYLPSTATFRTEDFLTHYQGIIVIFPHSCFQSNTPFCFSRKSLFIILKIILNVAHVVWFLCDEHI